MLVKLLERLLPFAKYVGPHRPMLPSPQALLFRAAYVFRVT